MTAGRKVLRIARRVDNRKIKRRGKRGSRPGAAQAALKPTKPVPFLQAGHVQIPDEQPRPRGRVPLLRGADLAALCLQRVHREIRRSQRAEAARGTCGALSLRRDRDDGSATQPARLRNSIGKPLARAVSIPSSIPRERPRSL